MKSIDQVRKALVARRKKQKGLTLIEAAMVLGVAALVIAGVLALYSSANSANKSQEALNQLNIIQQAIRNVYASQPDFNGLDGSTIAQALPAKMVKSGGASLSNAFNGTILVEPTTAAPLGGFKITFTGVPSDSCVVLGTKDYGRSLYSVNGGAAGDGELQGPATASTDIVSTANTTCGAGLNNNTMVWTFAN